MKKWNMIIDVDKCENCHNCTLAVKDEYVGNSFKGYAESLPLHGEPVFDIKRRQRGEEHMVDVTYVPVTCNHCDNAPCIKGAKNGEIYKREDGIVIIDPIKAKGQQYLVKTCPYDQIKWNDELQLPQTWIFDAHLLDKGWSETRVQQTCPTKAIECVQLTNEERDLRVRSEGLQEWRPELKTKPRVLYKNLNHYKLEFISGSVDRVSNGIPDAVVGTQVELKSQGNVVAIEVTNAFGDFKFNDLEPGRYEVTVSQEGRTGVSQTVELKESAHLGNITLL